MSAWSEEEITEARRIAAVARVRSREIDRFLARFPQHSRAAVLSKLQYLRCRCQPKRLRPCQAEEA